MEYKEWIRQVQEILVGMGHNYPIDEKSAEFKQAFENRLTPKEAAEIAYNDFYELD